MTVLSSKHPSGRARTFPTGLPFTAFAAYRADSASILLVREDRAPMAADAMRTLSAVPQVALRGTYDTTGYRADVDLLVWLAAPDPEALQDVLSQFRQTPLGSTLVPVWSAFGVHRQSDNGNRGAPAYFRGEPARRYVSVSSINHTSDWHVLPVIERRRLQSDGDRAYKHHGEVLASAVGAFGLGDSESLLALESHELAGIIDLMRDLGAADNRRYISGPSSFFTGVRKPLAAIVEALP